MAIKRVSKKRVVVSLNNLPAELQEAVNEQYRGVFSDHMMRIDKPNGDFFYAVPYSTEEIEYLVKIEVKIDDKAHEEDDKSYDEDGAEISDAEQIADSERDEDDDM